MNTNVEVSERPSDTPTITKWIPTIPGIAAFGVLAIVVLWLWAYFLRGRGGFGSLSLGYAGTAAFCLLLSGWLNWKWLRSRSTGGGDAKRDFRFSLLSFLLLALFLPEGLLGQPPSHLRAFLLLGFSLLLFFSVGALVRYFRLESEGPRLVSPRLIVIVFCGIYFLLTSWFTLAKLFAFGYVGQDIAYFTQCLYTTLRGHLFYSNMYHDLLYGQPVFTDYAGHNQSVLFFLLPFYAVHKSAATMLIVRNVLVVLCAWPVYLIASRIVSPMVAAIAACAFLVSPAVIYQNLYDFAPLSLAAFPLLFAFYFYLEGRFKPFLVALILTQLVREDLVFIVFGLGALALWQRRSIRWIVVPSAFAIAWAVLTWKIVFPYFLHGATSAVASCFSYLGNSPIEMLRNLAHHPSLVITRSNLIYLKQTIDSFGGVLFLGNPLCVLSAPYLAINLLGQGGGCNTAMVYRHYSFIPASVLFVSFLFSLKALGIFLRARGKDPRLFQGVLILFVLAASLSSTMLVTGETQFDDLKTREWHAEAREVARSIPGNASVAVPRYMLPAVANRDGLYLSLRLLEYHHPDAQYIVLDRDWARMAATEQWKENYYKLWDLLKADPKYSVIYDSQNYVIYKLCDSCKADLPHVAPRPEIHE